ncbi:MAG: arginase [Ignavibacteria bacterium RIFCSPLOWO2_02_FULL_55_14]|nr:MAG: arginase [Ignavibacteria bacterium GWC2_56_12]OGU67829.1 MAG: arginase [Ignavibacteria bacterium RIFCSPHIGHO2_02_FULL_56_12]OGU75636.1 MAG: arginase [Ignavibacteria bacterium RIFCSPLOWO2_02_FULL_55_14]OGU76652.1 MAG: arginase [Ignavibacteria bacterium RIFCSPLOWO2_12_FULL_56_21]HAV21995.1 arginase [Bacteroidota bacterium]
MNSKEIHILGVPMDLGAGRRGVDMGPSAIRIAGVGERLRSLGHKVVDEGDILIKPPELQRIRNEKLRYLPEIVRACTLLAGRVDKLVSNGHFPLVLGGDHSIAIGTIAGLASHARSEGKKLGVLWIDAHGDLNTDASSPSGNIHGMPLAASIGLGALELTSVGGEFPKVSPKNVVLVGTRELDDGERVNIKQQGVNIFTMEEIDKHGMAVIMAKALRKLREVDLLHVSFDLDAVDPSVAPGVGTPVKGGLDYREAHLIMETLNESGLMTSLEVVEANPILDNRNQSAEFAVELIQSGFGKKII